MSGGKKVSYVSQFWEYSDWVYTSSTARNAMAYLYSQPVYTDGTKGDKTLMQSSQIYDYAQYLGIAWGDWYYSEPQFYSNPHSGGTRSRFGGRSYAWGYEPYQTIEEYTDFDYEVGNISYDDNGSWMYVGYTSANLSTSSPPSGWRYLYTTVYCHYSDYTQVLYNHMYRDYQSSYQLVFVPGQGHHYIITFASGATYQTPSF